MRANNDQSIATYDLKAIFNFNIKSNTNFFLFCVGPKLGMLLQKKQQKAKSLDYNVIDIYI